MGLPVATKGDIIKIRYYQHADADQVRKLFLSSMMDGPNSPCHLALNSPFNQPPYIVGYVLILFGLLASVLGRSHTHRLAGGAVVLVLVAVMVFHRQLISRIFIGYINDSMKSDLADVAANYKMKPAPGSNYELEPSSRSAFWVAEASSPDGLSKEIVGCLGLDYYTRYSKEDPTTAELRRMVVSPHHQRRGIGFKLVKTLILHAREQGLKSIMLYTVSSFHQPAVAMYHKLGWVTIEEKTINTVLMGANMVYLRLDLDEKQSS